MEPLELEPGFEPQLRARSNTWPLPRPEPPESASEAAPAAPTQPFAQPKMFAPPPDLVHGGPQQVLAASAKKNSSRRNAWGNMSYADLITQAIQSAPENRLTLSQIYEWMVQNVPYFKDKGDSNSSAGWKNSIRHNLSLHNRFMRVQNEGTGKSSWWMINPDAKPGKSARRRATSMETSKFEKRRGRVKKKVEALRNGLDATPSPSSSVSEGLDLFPDSPIHPGFQLSPEFRPRASSNASSCGRLSPIPAVESDSQLAWSPQESGDVVGKYSPSMQYESRYGPEQLAGNLAEGMKLSDVYNLGHHQQHLQPTTYPPPPPPYEFHRRYPESGCLLHRHQACTCNLYNIKKEPLTPPYVSPGEASPEQAAVQQQQLSGGFVRATVQNVEMRETSGGRTTPTPSQMMGQLMGALNNHTNSAILDDLNLNIEPLDGGFDCNVDEVIRHELNMDGNLEFNFSSHQHQHHPHLHQLHHLHHLQHLQHLQPQLEAPPPPNQQGVVYTPAVTSGHSWVH
ncbi:forkhead box protein O [Neocloeon triangulifer]|uniref:forkhead box protein O n=1 Tax=Neocloeon triangulifer TaxID=2078957 RepID=UPI00286F6C76|nr:forkhead box protein O [Neocloeon triangulifer]